MADVTILHNQNCSTSRHAMDEAAAAGTDVEVVQYLKQPLDREQLLDLMVQTNRRIGGEEFVPHF